MRENCLTKHYNIFIIAKKKTLSNNVGYTADLARLKLLFAETSFWRGEDPITTIACIPIDFYVVQVALTRKYTKNIHPMQ